MKTEPNTYSMVDLLKGKNGGCWDGVRNFQARNFLRDMEAGDLALIYHSSVKVPHVAGVGEIVGKWYPDPTQFDPQSPYFDPRTARMDKELVRLGNAWISRDLRAVDNFLTPISIGELRANKKLEKMKMLERGSRLSITPLTGHEFEEILKMVKEKMKKQ